MAITGCKRLLTALCAGALTCFVNPASADNGALLDLLKVLRDNGTIDQAAYDILRNSAVASEEKSAAETDKKVEEQVSSAIKDVPQINTKGKLQVTSPDGDFKVQVGGRIMADSAAFSSDKTDLGSGTEFRRARMFISGTMWRAWNYKLQYDFANTDAPIDGIRDAYLGYGFANGGSIKVGNFKEPFSLEELTSAKYITFMERSLPITFAPSRNMGVGYSYVAPSANWTASGGLFGEGVDDPSGNNDEGYGVTGRFTYAPWHEGNRALHFGGAVSYRVTNQDNALRLRERPEAHLSDTRFIDTGTIDTESYTRYGLEAAWVQGPFSVQGEYIGLDLSRDMAGNPDLYFDGYYLEGSVFLTPGDHRSYDPEDAAFGRIKPKANVGQGGIGAWQLAVRYSGLDLSDEDIDGGDEENLTVGLNWHVNPNMAFKLNYVKVLSVDGGPRDGDEPDIFQVRAQVDF